jgi:16S rRNA (guanine(527)-N(7))-methyltransferase RsmG
MGIEKHEANEFTSELEAALREMGIDALASPQIEKLGRHYEMVKKWNRHLNLTRILEPAEAARLHYAESIYGGRFLTGAATILDVGSGAGFPAVGLAVANPEIQVTALEGNHNKSVFLKEAKDALGLANFHVVRGRWEDTNRAGFDVVTSRALDQAGKFYPQMIASLPAGSSLLLFCSDEMAGLLSKGSPANVNVEIHVIPGTGSRVIASFQREG